MIPVEGPVAASPAPDQGKASLPLADKPSIVVLPFDDMSKDADSGFLADGLVEDVTTALSRFRSLFVIARNTAFSYRGKAINVADVGRELGVQYVLEGSVRRAGDRVRVTAQLIDATADRHIWAEKYDRNLDDIFAIQDELTQAIAMAVAPSIRAEEITASADRDPGSLSLREKLARAWWHLQRYTAEDGEAARAVLTSALEESPRNATALAFIAQSYVFDGLYGWGRPQPESIRLAIETATQALMCDPDDENAQVHLAIALFIAKQHSEAARHLERVLESNPNHATAMGSLGMVLTYMHDHRADTLLKRAARLSPRDVWTSMFVGHRGMIAFIKGDDETALSYFREGLRIAPRNASLLRGEVTALAHLGRLVEAKDCYARLLEVAPGVTQTITRNGVMFVYEADASRFCEGLGRVGMPE
ncbi:MULTISPECIES: tetratricopeptide repeat protein [Sulfitobacter]|uniref:tetratricopeptide repeat protein n=1 Tax=Sulfitobacter TaxID=60136 RepID=UPI001F1C55D9|nr:hypothetical protein [Sulfitobacter sediminilitoris]